jgi:Uma2 family endonuclease
MSTATMTQPAASPVIPPWVPTSLYRLTLEQYEAMVDAGILGKRDRVHLIDGFLVSKMTENDPHATADLLCGEALDRVVPPGWHVRPGKPIRIPGLTSKPQPDRSVARGAVRDYARRSPGPADIALVVEVSDATLADDQILAGLYGRAGIPFYWIVNVVDGQVEVYSRPGPAGYEALDVLAPGHVLSVVIDGVEVGQIPVADLLP